MILRHSIPGLKLPSQPKARRRGRELRNHSTRTEILLWKRLRRWQVRGYDFHRQTPALYYILDFYSPALRLAIEIDGSSHIGREEYDRRRQDMIEELGVRFLRFTNEEVRNDIEGVVQRIEEWIDEEVGRA